MADFKVYAINARFDPEARVWVAEGINFPGLVTEAETFDQLRQNVLDLMPDLIELNRLGASGMLEIRAEVFEALPAIA
jgi:hypothetical protein